MDTVKVLVVFGVIGASYAMNYGRTSYEGDAGHAAGYGVRRKVDYYKLIGDENRDGIPDKFDKNRNGVHDSKEGYYPKPGYSETSHGYKGSTNYHSNQGQRGGYEGGKNTAYDRPTSYHGGSQGHSGSQGYGDSGYGKNTQAGYDGSAYGYKNDENRDGVPDNEDLDRNGKPDYKEPHRKAADYARPHSRDSGYGGSDDYKKQTGYGGSEYDYKPQHGGYKQTYGGNGGYGGQDQGYGKEEPRGYGGRKPDSYGPDKEY